MSMAGVLRGGCIFVAHVFVDAVVLMHAAYLEDAAAEILGRRILFTWFHEARIFNNAIACQPSVSLPR
jgi:hypothetical protein